MGGEGGKGGKEGKFTDADEGLEPGEVEGVEDLLVGDVVLRDRPFQPS